MDQLVIYIILFSIIVFFGQLFQKSSVPLALILVITGMILSFLPYFPKIGLNSEVVLNLFLPILIYQISAFSSWRELKKQIRPIASLSLGHVVFITLLVAIVIHTLIPKMGWPLAFVLGAIISPPDDVAIVSMYEKIPIPARIFSILKGEGMFNNAAALILFRFALMAAFNHVFSIIHASFAFFIVIIGEVLYGFLLGHILGKIRQKITNTTLHIIAGIITPFLSYIPVVLLGGTGVLATAIVGFLIGNYYSIRFTSEYRLISMGVWPTLAFSIEHLIFLLVGLNLRSVLMHISIIPLADLLLYVFCIIITVIGGRFIWVYASISSFPKLLFPDRGPTYPLKRNAFLVAWAGMRGGISLAAAIAIPSLPMRIEGANLRDLIIFFALCVIIVTFILQGFSLPYIMRKSSLDKIGLKEKYDEHLSELHARIQMSRAAFTWLREYKKTVGEDKKLLEEVNFHLIEYRILLKKYQGIILQHDKKILHDEKIERKNFTYLLIQIIKIEREELLKLWRDEKINLQTRNKLLSFLDHHIQRHKL